MNKENNEFFNRCFNIVASFEVQNENQMIAKEVILDEVVNLQQRIDKAIEYIINKKYWDGINNYRLSNADELLEILKGDTNE